MVRIFQVKHLTERKKVLLIQSEIHRRTLLLQIATAQDSVEHIKKRFTFLSLSSLALGAGASVAGMFFGKKDPDQKKSGIIGKVLAGVSMFNKAKSIFNRFRPPADEAQ